MSNIFLKVYKDFFKLGLNPTEILILSQVAEFNTNTGDCFISDDVLAENFGVSTKTISRSMKALEDKKFITRETKNVKGGKERHVKINMDVINAALTTDNLSIEEKTETSQQTICPLTTDNLSIDKGQNDSIKDNLIDNTKDNLSNEVLPVEEEESPVVEEESPKAETKISKAYLDSVGCKYTMVSENIAKINDTGKLVELLVS